MTQHLDLGQFSYVHATQFHLELETLVCWVVVVSGEGELFVLFLADSSSSCDSMTVARVSVTLSRDKVRLLTPEDEGEDEPGGHTGGGDADAGRLLFWCCSTPL